MAEPLDSRWKRGVGVVLLALGIYTMWWGFFAPNYYALAPVGLVLVYAALRTYPNEGTRRLSRWMLWTWLALVVLSFALDW